MKRISIIIGLVIGGYSLPSVAQDITAPDSTGLLGDGLDLTAVLNLFKDAESLEQFEENLNKEKSGINNLDLNADGETDYIRVEDQMEGDVHAIILQVAISESESQDIAAIEIEKTGAEEASLQIVGDEEIYGEDYIVEPVDNSSEKSPAALAPRVIVNVWLWPSVRFVYAPGYKRWVSPWRWSLYPKWWKPWRPVRWGVYHRRHVMFHRSYRVVRVHRCTRAHAVYRAHRRTSAVVQKRHAAAHKRHKAATKSNAKTNQRKDPATSKKNTSKAKVDKRSNKAKTAVKPRNASKPNRGGGSHPRGKSNR